MLLLTRLILRLQLGHDGLAFGIEQGVVRRLEGSERAEGFVVPPQAFEDESPFLIACTNQRQGFDSFGHCEGFLRGSQSLFIGFPGAIGLADILFTACLISHDHA